MKTVKKTSATGKKLSKKEEGDAAGVDVFFSLQNEVNVHPSYHFLFSILLLNCIALFFQPFPLLLFRLCFSLSLNEDDDSDDMSTLEDLKNTPVRDNADFERGKKTNAN